MTSPTRPSNLRNDSISAYSQGLSEYHRSASQTPSPPETATIEKATSFKVKRASSYRVPVPAYEQPYAYPLVRTPNRELERTLTEFPTPAREASLWTKVVDFVLCRRPA